MLAKQGAGSTVSPTCVWVLRTIYGVRSTSFCLAYSTYYLVWIRCYSLDSLLSLLLLRHSFFRQHNQAAGHRIPPFDKMLSLHNKFFRLVL